MSGKPQTPFDDGGFSFDPKKITVYSPLKKRDRRPGDVFGSSDLNRSRSLMQQSKAASIYRAIRYSKGFRSQALPIFLFFFLPGLIAAILLFFGVI